jgi:hypothetical protein
VVIADMDDLENQDGFTNLIEKDEGKEAQISLHRGQIGQFLLL